MCRALAVVMVLGTGALLGCGGGGGGGGSRAGGVPTTSTPVTGTDETPPPASKPTDTTPPATPTNVNVSPTVVGHEVSWRAVTDADLKGYFVYRAVGTGPPERISPLVTGTRYLLGILETPGEFFYSVSSVDETGNESPRSGTVKVTVAAPTPPTDTTPPSSPTGLALTQAPGTGGHLLAWQGVSAADLAGYFVWQSVDGGATEKISGQLTGTTYTLGDLVAGVYSFHVSAVDQSGNESPLSVPTQLTVDPPPAPDTPDTTPPAAPTGLVLNKTGNDFSLAWNPVTDSDLNGYRVWRSLNGGAFLPISGVVVPTSFFVGQLTAPGTYTFAVSAIDQSGNEGFRSAAVSHTVNPPPPDVTTETPQPTDTTPPAVPSGLSATPGNGKVTLSWSAVADGDLGGYYVYQGVSPAADPVRLTPNPIGTSSYTVTGLANNVTLYFSVSALDQNGNESARSNPVSATPAAPDTTPPGGPANVSVTAQNGAALIQWTPPADPDLKDVLIYWRQAGSGQPLAALQTHGPAVTHTTITGLTNGVTYETALSARDNAGNESVKSATFSVTPQAPPPQDTTPPAVPVILSGSAGNEFVSVQWQGVADGDLAGYRVYHTTAANFDNPAQVVSHHSGSVFTGTTFTIGGLTNGTAVRVAVSAVDGSGNESTKSVPALLTPQQPLPFGWPGFLRDGQHTGDSGVSGTPGFTPAWQESINQDLVSAPLIVVRCTNATDPTCKMVVFGGNDKRLHARSLTSGQHLWDAVLDNWVGATPVYVAALDAIIAPSYSGRVYSFNAGTGAENWVTVPATNAIVSSPVHDGAKAYFGSFDGNVYAIHLQTGNKAWTHATGGQIWSSPALSADGNMLFIGTTVASPGGDVRAIHTSNGQEKWRFFVGNKVLSSPVVNGGRVYVGGYTNQLFELDEATGAQLRAFNAGRAIDSTPLVTDDTIVFGTGSFPLGTGPSDLIAIRRDTFTQKWKVTKDDLVEASPILVGTSACVGSWDFSFACHNLTTGAEGFTFDTTGPIHSPAALAEGYLAVTSRDSNVYVYKVNP